MKHYTLLLILLLCSAGLSAQQTISLGRTQDRIDILEDQAESLKIQLNYAQIQVNTIENLRGSFSELMFDGGVSDGFVGQPKLPVTQRLIEVPFGAKPEVKVRGSSVQEFDLADFGIQRIMPMQAPVSKDEVPEDVPFVMDEAAYAKDAFFGGELANIEVLGTMRGYHIAKLTVAPVRYNPVKNKIQVYNDIDLEITFPEADMALTREIKAKTYSPYFDFIGDRFLNEGVSRDYPDHPDMTRYPIKYLIIADRMFENYLGDFIAWKTRKGFEVTVAYTDEIGTSRDQIRAYVRFQYEIATEENPAPSFVLFVGDTPQIQGFNGYATHAVTDLFYCCIDNDYFPEMYYGRLSAKTPEQLIPQIEKILYYEQYQFVDPSYLNRATLIAGWDDYWAQQIGWPTIRYGMDNWFNEDHNYTVVNPYYGPDDYVGCYADDKISVSFINYTAHCSETVWGTPSLSISTINHMNNEGYYPLSIGNCCLSGAFDTDECVGESWVRANRKGAVCYIGSAPNTYWYEDAWWAIGAYHFTNGNLGQTPPYSQTTMGSYEAMHGSGYISTAGLMYCGNLAVTEAANHGWSDAARYYWEAYHVFGDPSMVCYHTEGTANTVSHAPVVYKGFQTFTVQAEPQSFVALTKDGTILGTGLVDERGELDLTINPVNEGGFVELVVTRPQRIPYMEYVPIATPGDPFLLVEEVSPERFDYNQDTPVSVTVKNYGESEVPANTLVTLQSPDERMLVVEGQCHLPQALPVGGSMVIEDAFVVKAAPEAQNGERFRLLTLADCGDMVNADFYVTINKPVFEFVDFTWSGSFYAGGSFEVDATFRNVGGCAAESPVGIISAPELEVTFPQGEVPVERLEAGATTTCHFVVYVPESVGENADMDLVVSLQDVGVRVDAPISMHNVCHMTLELRDAGGNGWEGSYLKITYQDGKPSQKYELLEGSYASYEILNRQGYNLKLYWSRGSNDEECSFTMSYADGSVFYEREPGDYGNLLVAAVNCHQELVEVTETAESLDVRVFPNPATGQVTVMSEAPMRRCLMMNSLGQIVIDQAMDDTETRLNIEGCAPGLYLLRVSTDQGESIQKLMIK